MFLQIGDKAVNLDHVTDMVFYTNGDIVLYRGTDELVILTGDEAEAFKNWWNEKADVCVLPA